LVRLAGTDYLEFDPSLEQWTVDDAAKLGKILTGKGIDLIDVTGGGLDNRQQIKNGPGYQVHLAAAVKKATEGTNVPVTAVGNITSGTEAESYIKAGTIDAVFIGRPFLRNTSLVWTWAEELNVDIHLPAQCKCPEPQAFFCVVFDLLTDYRWMGCRQYPHAQALAQALACLETCP
jgi:2,4-dienoyl-CoA reductase-like NADH-dependent reductase (Old Yellow Enzyme family)